jgi:RNA polymerase sigma factor (sigma-70 family)
VGIARGREAPASGRTGGTPTLARRGAFIGTVSPPTILAAAASPRYGPPDTGERPAPVAGGIARDTPAAAGRSERDRLGDLFDRHHQRLFLLACRLTSDREEARDLVQEVFLRAARHAAGVPADAAHGEAWLVRTLVNLCRDHYRRTAVRARAQSSLTAAALRAARQAPSCGAGPESTAVAQATVRAALAHLSSRQRAVVVLHELEELAVSDIARLLGIAAVTVRWHLLAARRHLAATLQAPRAPRAPRNAGAALSAGPGEEDCS